MVLEEHGICSMSWESSWRDAVVLQHKMRLVICQEYYVSFLKVTEESPFLTHLVTGYWILSPESRPGCQARWWLSLLYPRRWFLSNALSCLVLLTVISPTMVQNTLIGTAPQGQVLPSYLLKSLKSCKSDGMVPFPRNFWWHKVIVLIACHLIALF